MKRFLMSLIAGAKKVGKGRSSSPRDRRVRLHVETMEQRLVPSTAAVHLAPAPAMTAQVFQQQVPVHGCFSPDGFFRIASQAHPGGSMRSVNNPRAGNGSPNSVAVGASLLQNVPGVDPQNGPPHHNTPPPVVEKYWEHTDDDGEVEELWRDTETGQWWLVVTDGRTYTKAIFPTKCDGDPNPESSSSGPKDLAMQIALAKQRGGGKLAINVSKTPFGKLLVDQGKGKVPIWNPPDNMMQLNEFAGGGGGGFYFGDGGSFSEQLQQWIKHGGNGGSNDDGDGDDGVHHDKLHHWGLDMPGPPELVNPAPTQHR